MQDHEERIWRQQVLTNLLLDEEHCNLLQRKWRYPRTAGISPLLRYEYSL